LCCRTGPEEEPDDPDVTIVSDGVETALGLALEKPQGKDVALFGASLAAQCLLAGLVGELVVHIIPVLLRHGTPLFPDATRCLSKVVESYQAG
jgi:dihydrofolate reductase